MKKGILKFREQKNKYYIDLFDYDGVIELNVEDEIMYSPDLRRYKTAIIKYNGNEWYLLDKKNNRIKIWNNMVVKK